MTETDQNTNALTLVDEFDVTKMSDDDYHAKHDWLSNSMLSDAIDRPREFEGRYATRTIPPMVSTPAMDTGSICHQVILDGCVLRTVVAKYPKHDALAKELKEITAPKWKKLSIERKKKLCKHVGITVEKLESWSFGTEMKNELEKILPLNPIGASGNMAGDAAAFRAFKRAEGYKYVVKDDQFQDIREITNTFMRSIAWDWVSLDHTITETPIFWRDPLGMRKRCKPDFVVVGENKILAADLKVTIHHREHEWKRYVQKESRLRTQPPHYIEGLRAKYGDDKEIDWMWILLNPNGPITPASVSVVPLPENMLRQLTLFYQYDVARLAERIKLNDFSERHEREPIPIQFDERWLDRHHKRIARQPQ